MEGKGSQLAIILLIVGLVVGGGVGYFAAPKAPAGEGGEGPETVTVKERPLKGKTVQIGYISSSTTNLETATPLVQDIVQKDINEYAAKLGYDVDFEYLIDDAEGQAALHLEKVQSFKSIGVDLFQGGLWSSQAQAALSYVNENDMLMFSSSSTSPLLAKPDDNLFRMCPTDKIQGPAIAKVLSSYGIDAIIVIQRGDSWADGIYNILEPHYEELGGTIVERIRYQAETTEFSNYLSTAEDAAKQAVAEYGADSVAIEVIAFQEVVTMLTQAEDYPTIWDLTWFGSDGTALTAQVVDDSPEQANHVKLLSTYMAPAQSEKFNNLYDRYYDILEMPFGYYSACTYDIGTVFMSTILETQSTKATDVIPLVMDTSYNTFGASGWCKLNENGDREGANYQIWGVAETDGGYQWQVFGIYYQPTPPETFGEVTWYSEPQER